MKYSSETVKLLCENQKHNFWSAGWSKRIIVFWEKGATLTKEVKEQLKALLGSNFVYERAVNNNEIEYRLTKKGLIKV